MTDDIWKLLENPALRLSEELVAARMKLAGVKLADDWGVKTPKSHPESGFSPELIRRLAGG
jgi:hypothetical protein